MEGRQVLGHEVLGPAVGDVDDLVDLAVDHVGRCGRAVGGLGHLGPQEGVAAALGPGDLSELLAESHLANHHAGHAADLLEVSGGSGGDVVLSEDELLGDATSHCDGHLVLQVGSGVESRLEALLGRGEEGQTSGGAPRDDGDLGDRVVLGHQGSDDGVSGLVVGHEPLLGLGHHGSLLLRSSDDTLEGISDLVVADLGHVAAGGQDGGLVHEVGEVGTGESRRPTGDLLEVDILSEGLARGVDLEDGDTSLDVRPVDSDLAIETSRAEEGRVEHVGPVGGGQHDDSGVSLESVHLRQQLVDGLLPLVVSSSHSGATLPSDGIDLVDEDDARGLGLGLLEQIPDAGRSDSDKELNELGGGAGEERRSGLSGDGLGDQGLSGSRRSDQERSLGDLSSELGVLLRVLQEVDQLLELQLGVVAPGDVGKLDASLGNLLELGLGPSKVHRSSHGSHRTATALSISSGATEEQEQTGKGHQREQQVSEQRHVVALLLGLGDGDIHAALGQDIDQLRVVRQDHQGPPSVHGRQLQLRSVLREPNTLDLSVLDCTDEIRVPPLVALRQLRRGSHRRGGSHASKLVVRPGGLHGGHVVGRRRGHKVVGHGGSAHQRRHRDQGTDGERRVLRLQRTKERR